LALVDRVRKTLGDALRQRSTFIPQSTFSPQYAFRQAISFHAQGRFREAEYLYEKVLRAESRHFDALYRLGLIRLQQNRYDDAISLFRRALKVNKYSAEAHHHFAVALMALNRTEEAIQRYQKAVTIKPDFAEAYNSLGHALQVLGRPEEAIEYHQKALSVRSNFAEAHNNLGNALLMLKRPTDAITQYEKALVINPNFAEAHANLGAALGTIDLHEQAIRHYELALQIKPKYADAHHSFGNALRALGQPEEALVQYDKTLAIRPKDAEALKHRGWTLMKLGRDAESAEVFEDLIRRGASSVDALLALTNVPASVVSIDLLAELEKVVRGKEHEKADFDNLSAFVRAAALDRAGRRAEAWEHLVAANQTLFLANQDTFALEIERERKNVARLRENLPKAACGTAENGDTVSLFILGPSRSGKTTLEKLVSTLDGIKRGYENPIVEDTISRTFQRAALLGSKFLENLPHTLNSLFRSMYIDELARRAGLARVFTNTNLMRIHDADLVAAAIPNVRFVLVKRNLEDNALRIYMRRYQTGHAYAYDLKATYNYILWYHQMTDLLAHKLPEIVRVIHYEEMIACPARVLRLVADLCNLPIVKDHVPSLGDDRGCAAPYRQFMDAQLER
jgi:tetratricopeptide (TPR) repeat protein